MPPSASLNSPSAPPDRSHQFLVVREEQLGFDQAIGECRAIDRDEGAPPSAGGMGMAGQLFLAGAGFAADKDRHLAHRRAFKPSHNSRNRRISGYELRSDLLRRRRRRPGNSLNHRELTRVLDRRDKLAADLVLQALAFLAPALIDERAEFRAEDVGEATARRRRQTVQQDASGSVRSEYPALVVDSQQARAQRMQIFTAIVERDQDISAVMLAE